MRCRKVVNVSSIAELGGNTGQVNYAAAKAGVAGLTKTIAKEWGRYNVTVNTMAFGYIKARLTESDGDDARIDVAGNSIRVGMSAARRDDRMADPPRPRRNASGCRGSVYLLCLPELDYISAQTVVCGGGSFI